MRPDPRAYLWDALNAAQLVGQFTVGSRWRTTSRTHGYDVLVWQTVTGRLPALERALRRLLDQQNR